MSAQPLTEKEILSELEHLTGWSFSDNSLHASYTFADFRKALAFMVTVGFEAEELGHHPEWKNVYNSVDISLSTHDAGNKVTQKDIELAKRIVKLAKD